jgi:ECM11-like protein involved in chromatin structure maintenance
MATYDSMKNYAEKLVPHIPSNQDPARNLVANQAKITAKDRKNLKNGNKSGQNAATTKLAGDSSQISYGDLNNDSELNNSVQPRKNQGSKFPFQEKQREMDRLTHMMKYGNHAEHEYGEPVEDEDELEEQTDSQSGDYEEESEEEEPANHAKDNFRMQDSGIPLGKARAISRQGQTPILHVNRGIESQHKPTARHSQSHAKLRHSNDSELNGMSIPQRGVHGRNQSSIPAYQAANIREEPEVQTAKNQGHLASNTQNQATHHGKRSRVGVVGRKSSTRSLSKTPVVESKATEESLDYDIQHLKEMSYTQLKDETFDHNPSVPEFQLDDLKGGLEKRLAQAKQLEVDHQREFFESLSLDEWDQAGDWFLEQFSQLMSKMRDARKNKREIAKKFEKEIGERHTAVQDRKDGIVKAMKDMKQSGRTALYPSKDIN